MSVVRDYKCSSCGAPLPTPKNSGGQIKCAYCNAVCVIEHLVKNAETATKEDISSGYPLTADSAKLHAKLLEFLTHSPYMPLDVFSNGEVVSEEHLCVPAYLFNCTAMDSYTYEIGNRRERQIMTGSGEYERMETESYTEWTHMSSLVNVSATRFAPGNSEVVSPALGLSCRLDPGKLVELEKLEYPHDVETYDYNIAQSASFDEYVKPFFEEKLKEKAAGALRGKMFRKLTMGNGSRIDTEQVSHVFLGLYRIVYKYGGDQYALWVSGDGEHSHFDACPEDAHMKQAVEQKRQDYRHRVAAVPVPDANKNFLSACMVVSVIIGFMLIAVSYGFALLGIAVAAVCGVLRSRVNREYLAQCDRIRAFYKGEVDNILASVTEAAREFNINKQALRGIYEDVSGDARAFE